MKGGKFKCFTVSEVSVDVNITFLNAKFQSTFTTFGLSSLGFDTEYNFILYFVVWTKPDEYSLNTLRNRPKNQDKRRFNDSFVTPPGQV